MGEPRMPIAAPPRINGVSGVDSDSLSSWRLEPTHPDWAAGMRDSCNRGEVGAQSRLSAFLDHGIAGYADLRDRPDLDNTSRLSPHLRFGEISPFQVWHSCRLALSARGKMRATDIDKVLSELAWREFCWHLLHHHPDLATRNFNPRFDTFPWRNDDKALAAWQRGGTGYPIVDAGMRQLWTAGWMHNRVRMITASFLIKHLLIDWRAGEQWFWDTLVDADSANNPANWQWVAGSGADAAPYFRIFNPVLQGEKFDPQGDYVRRFVPELADLPAAFIQAPFTASPLELASAGVTLGKSYPKPLVEHQAARARALAALATLKQSNE
jgi:deoxyribodipyrimidine photo-lyase